MSYFLIQNLSFLFLILFVFFISVFFFCNFKFYSFIFIYLIVLFFIYFPIYCYFHSYCFFKCLIFLCFFCLHRHYAFQNPKSLSLIHFLSHRLSKYFVPWLPLAFSFSLFIYSCLYLWCTFPSPASFFFTLCICLPFCTASYGVN